MKVSNPQQACSMHIVTADKFGVDGNARDELSNSGSSQSPASILASTATKQFSVWILRDVDCIF